MSNSVISTREEVDQFLTELKEVLSRPEFNLGTDLDILPKKSGEAVGDPYTTANTMLSLDYDAADVRDRLLELDIGEYLETIIDNKNPALPPFFAFAKTIDAKDVYIKVKVRDNKRNKVFCVSFHFARYPIKRPLPY